LGEKVEQRSQPSPLCSVIIPYYNDKEGLISCLTALAQQDLPREYYEVIVIDDCSADDDGDFFRSRFSFAAFHRQTANLGPAAARNRGIGLARGRYLVFTDSDACPGPSWLSTLVAGFSDGSEMICGPVRHGPGLLERLTALTAFGEYLDDRDGFRLHCPTVNFAVEASVLQGILFDEGLSYAGEDLLLSTRLTAAGRTIRYLAAAWVLHRPKLSVASSARRAFRYGIGFRDSRLRCPALAGYRLHQSLGAASGLVLFFIRTALDLGRLAKKRKLLQVNLLNLPVLLAGIVGTRVCYAAGVFWSYVKCFPSRQRKGDEEGETGS
jgi:glycosyltransferase involved in cell wall biosynthesis